MIVGEFVRLDAGTTSFGPCKIAVLRTQDGEERGVWLLHTVLRTELKRARPKPGELVAIRYLGKKTGAAGQSYDAYRVVIQRDNAEPDWDTLGDDPDDDVPTQGSWG